MADADPTPDTPPAATKVDVMSTSTTIALAGPGGPLFVNINALDQLIGWLIDLKDTAEQPTDIELNGDELEHDGTEADQSFSEWHTRGRHKLYGGEAEAPRGYGWTNIEDVEIDDEDCGGDEGEPNFTTPPRGSAPGCRISDSDYGGEEAGEAEEGVYVDHTGVDQTRPIGPDNPAVL